MKPAAAVPPSVSALSALVERCALVARSASCARFAVRALGTAASDFSSICVPVSELLLMRVPVIDPRLMLEPLMSLPTRVAAPCASDVPDMANASATRATPIAGETRGIFENTLLLLRAPPPPRRGPIARRIGACERRLDHRTRGCALGVQLGLP